MATQNQMSDHVSRVRQAARRVLEAAAELDALRKEFDYAGLGSALPEDLGSLAGGHAGLARDDIAAVTPVRRPSGRCWMQDMERTW